MSDEDHDVSPGMRVPLEVAEALMRWMEAGSPPIFFRPFAVLVITTVTTEPIDYQI